LIFTKKIKMGLPKKSAFPWGNISVGIKLISSKLRQTWGPARGFLPWARAEKPKDSSLLAGHTPKIRLIETG
jgi:hypothetical protein